MYNDTTLNVCQSSIFDCFQISDTNNTSRALKRTNTNMFHKEGSCTDIISSSNAGGGGKGGEKSKFKGNVKGKQQPPPKAQHLESTTNVSKAVDVPLRKSDRRRLRQRAAAYSPFAELAFIHQYQDRNVFSQEDLQALEVYRLHLQAGGSPW